MVYFPDSDTGILDTELDLDTIWIRKPEIWIRYGYGTSNLDTIWIRTDMDTIWIRFGYDMDTESVLHLETLWIRCVMYKFGYC